MLKHKHIYPKKNEMLPYTKQIYDMVKDIIPGLTIAGACHLSAFPLEEIKYLHEKFKQDPGSKDSKQKFKEFIFLLHAICDKRGIKPVWREMYKAFEACGLFGFEEREL